MLRHGYSPPPVPPARQLIAFWLMSTLSALVQQAQAIAVRLAVFNFDKQRVIYSNEDFTLKSMGEVKQALNRLEL